MPRNYDTSGHKPFPRVPEIRIYYPPNGVPEVRYIESTAIVDGDGKVQHIATGASEHAMRLDLMPDVLQCVRPDTGANIDGMTATRGGLMLHLLAFVRADRKRRDAEADAPAQEAA